MPMPTASRPPRPSVTGPARLRRSLPPRERTDGRHRPGRPWRGRAEEHDRRALSDALHLLEGGPYAVCRECDAFAARWLSYFVIETHAEEGTRARVEAAAGFCPAHTRRLLADVSASWLMPQVHDLALAGWTRLLDVPDARRARCPCCVAGDDATERASETLLRAFGHARIRDAVHGGALCLPHLAAPAARTPARTPSLSRTRQPRSWRRGGTTFRGWPEPMRTRRPGACSSAGSTLFSRSRRSGSGAR